MSNPTPSFCDGAINRILDDLARQGWSVDSNFLPREPVMQLATEARQFKRQGRLRPAAVGKGAERSVHAEIRGDWILWLEEPSLTTAQRAYLERLEALRLAANRTLQLGLFDFEGHLAIYPPGSFYRRHLDRFRRDDRRTLTAILYLNQNWQPADGGLLRLYLDEARHVDVAPRGGTLVVFLSGRFWHEVLPAQRERISVTGWFRTRGDLPA
ncbi:MAG: 2OG-Fe(II) oxygenase [Methylophilaceae bacterium]|nr:2OG-Fe(II) oxygenase [Methylophilaceae bacterium]